MRDRRMEVPCRATLDLLADRFDSNGTPSGQEQAFLLHRGEIEQAASAKFDEGNIEPYVDPKVVIRDAPAFVEVGEAGIAVDHVMRRQFAVQRSW